MGIITPDTFNPTKAFSSVRLQQGVPLVHADINELDDTRKLDARAAFKWIAGDGVPDGNDGFRIEALASPGAVDDLRISAGAQAGGADVLHDFGCCMVDGLEVFIQTSVNFKKQPLFLATGLGVPKVEPIPAGAPQVIVYLDVWERVVDAAEDGTLIVPLTPPLGIETCARVKREWVVRARAGDKLPAPGDGTHDFIVDHSYYLLASVKRRTVGGKLEPILQSDITDLRERGLLVPPSTLIPDVLGETASRYRRGLSRPVISLRDAINALIRGELPGTAEQEMTGISGQADDITAGGGFVFDGSGAAIAIWTTVDSHNRGQILGARCDPTIPGASFVGVTALTDPADSCHIPRAVTLPTGDLVIAYVAYQKGAPADVFFKRGPDLGSMLALSDTSITEQPAPPPGSSRTTPRVVVVPVSTGGGYLVFFWYSDFGAFEWRFRRRFYPDAAWTEKSAKWQDPVGGSVLFSAPDATDAWNLHAAVDAANGNVWAAFSYGATGEAHRLHVFRLPVAGGAAVPSPTFPFGQGQFVPRVLLDAGSSVWIFFVTQIDATNVGVARVIYPRTGSVTPIGNAEMMPGMPSLASIDFQISAVLDHQGGIWLIWCWAAASTMLCARWSPVTNAWGPTIGLSSEASFPHALLDARGALWIFGQHPSPNPQLNRLFLRQVFTEI